MGNRTTRLWIAILLAGMDIAIFEHSFTAIWLVWSGIGWIRVASVLVLAVWAGSAAVLWLHVYYDLRQVLCDRHGSFKLNPPNMSKELGMDGDV